MANGAMISSIGLFAGMWLSMMAAMMLPAMLPFVLLFEKIQEQRRTRARRTVSSLVPLAGYLGVWMLGGLLAYGIYAAFGQLGHAFQMPARSAAYVDGAVLLTAGLYQFSRLKNACLAHCRSPLDLITRHWHEGSLGALRMGLEHGAFCVGCCWAIMAVLFAMGLMNLAWMAALSVVIISEKLVRRGTLLSRVFGCLFISLGAIVIIHAL